MAAFNYVPQGASPGQHANHGNETQPRGPTHGAESESRLYELWRFIPSDNRQGGKNWASNVSRELIPSDQATLKSLVDTLEDQDAIEQQYHDLTEKKKALIRALVREHDQRDSRYKWRYVYIKTRKVTVTSNYPPITVTVRMEVILVRELQHQSMSAGGVSQPSAASRAGLQNHEEAPDSPRVYRAAETRSIPVNGEVPPWNPQVPHQTQFSQHMYDQQSLHAQANPQIHPQLQRPAQSATPQQGPPQAYPQMQNPIPSQANYSMPQDVRFQGSPNHEIQQGRVADQSVPNVSTLHGNGNAASAGRGINLGADQFHRNSGEARHPAHNPSTPIYTRSNQGQGIQTQNIRSAATSDHPRHMPQTPNAAASTIRIISQDGRHPQLNDDSSFTTDDESLFGDEDLYSSAASSVSSIARGSQHREQRYLHRDNGERGYRLHTRKQSQKTSGHGGYVSGNVDIIPSESSHRSRDSKSHRKSSRASNRNSPVTIHESKPDIRASGLADLSLTANENSYRLQKLEESQRTMLDKMDRLTIGLQRPETRDRDERPVVYRGIEPEVRHAVPARQIYYAEPPIYPQRVRYMPQAYSYDTYI